jgi:hypothetical protein
LAAPTGCGLLDPTSCTYVSSDQQKWNMSGNHTG